MSKIEIDTTYHKTKKIKNRFKIIKKYIEGKKVLDLGIVNHDIECSNNKEWLHEFIKKYAKELTGVDYLPKEVKKLKEKGYNIICANVETMALKNKYDTIVAGELIEHITNFGLFLDKIKEHIKEEGYFIITTPNAFSIRNLLRGLILGNVPTNKEHTCWFCIKTLNNILRRKGFEIVKKYYFFDNPKAWTSYIERIFSLLYNSYAPEIIFICKKVKNE